MKRIFVLGSIMLFLVLGCNQVIDLDFIIRVTGSAGTQFNGNYTITTADGESTNISVAGIVPDEYYVTAKKVQCTFKKLTEYGKMRVEILLDGEIVTSAETSAGAGVISAFTQ